MFTGIIKSVGLIKKVLLKNKGLEIQIYSKINLSKRDIGSSISCSGACLTLEKIYKSHLYFYISKETLRATNFKYIKVNDRVNLEKSIRFADEISGHFVQGHVDHTSKLISKKTHGKSWYLYFSINKKYIKYLIYKGSIAINGVSFTIAKILPNSFLIVVIPHTLKLTNIKNIKKNDIVNVELDILAKYIKQIK